MIRQTLLSTVAAVVIAVTAGRAGTVHVTGIVVKADHPTERITGHKLILVPDKKGEGRVLDKDESSKGLYNLKADGVQESVSALWVLRDENSPYRSQPMIAQFGASKECKMKDMEAEPVKPGESLTMARAVKFVAGIIDTESVMVRVGLREKNEGRRRAFNVISGAKGFLPPITGEAARDFVKQVAAEWEKSPLQAEDRIVTESQLTSFLLD